MVKNLSYLDMLVSSHNLILFMNHFPDKGWEIGVMTKEKDEDKERLVSSYEGKNIDKMIKNTCENIEKYIKEK